jgi:ankyrin repeat protein
MKYLNSYKLFEMRLSNNKVVTDNIEEEIYLNLLSNNSTDINNRIFPGSGNFVNNKKPLWTSLKMIKKFIANGADVNRHEKGGASILVHSIIGANIMNQSTNRLNKNDVIKEIINAGADINYVDDNNNTALSVSIMTGNIEISNLLIELGADLKFIDPKTKADIIDMEMARDKRTIWLNQPATQKLILLREPDLYLSFLRHKIKIDPSVYEMLPNLKRDYAYAETSADLNIF